MNIHINPYDDELLAAVDAALQEPEETPALHIERKIDWLLREASELSTEHKCDLLVGMLDDLCALAANPGTVALVEAQKIGVGQIKFRADLIMSFLLAQKPAGLRMVSNNG